MNIVVNTSNDEVIKLYKAQLESYQAAFSSLLESKKVQIQQISSHDPKVFEELLAIELNNEKLKN